MRSSLVVIVLSVAVMAGCAGYVSVESTPAPPDARPEPAPVPAPGPLPPPSTGRVVEHPAHIGIPPGHLPPAGYCKVWIPGRPPGHQSRAYATCAELKRAVPTGAWLVYRPTRDKKHVRVWFYDDVRPGYVVRVGLYDARSGDFVRDDSDATR